MPARPPAAVLSRAEQSHLLRGPALHWGPSDPFAASADAAAGDDAGPALAPMKPVAAEGARVAALGAAAAEWVKRAEQLAAWARDAPAADPFLTPAAAAAAQTAGALGDELAALSAAAAAPAMSAPAGALPQRSQPRKQDPRPEMRPEIPSPRGPAAVADRSAAGSSSGRGGPPIPALVAKFTPSAGDDGLPDLIKQMRRRAV